MGASFAAIREHLADYLRGDSSLDEFQAWFIPATWDLDVTGAEAAQKLTHGIKLRLAEYTNGDLDEQELRRLLVPLSLVARLLLDVRAEVTFDAVSAPSSRSSLIHQRLWVGSGLVRVSA